MNQHVDDEDLSAYVDDALPVARRALVASHLDCCADCRARLADIQWTVALVRAMPLHDAPAHAPLRILAARPASGRLWPRLRLPLVLSAAAVVLVVVALWSVGQAGLGRDSSLASRGLAGRQAAAVDQASGLGAAQNGTPETPLAFGSSGDFAGVPAPDSRVAGYPRPFATARQDDYARVGGVPPPELGAPNYEPGASGTAVAEGVGEAAATERPEQAALAASGSGPGAALPAAQAVTPTVRASGGAATAAPTAPPAATAVEAAGPAPASVPAKRAWPAGSLGTAALVATVLLALSAALFVRASRR